MGHGEGLWVSVWERLLGLRMWGWKFFFISSMPAELSERMELDDHPCANCQSI